MATDQQIISLVHDGEVTLQDIYIYIELSQEAQAIKLNKDAYAFNRFLVCLQMMHFNQSISSDYLKPILDKLCTIFKEVSDLFLSDLDPESILVQVNNKPPSRPSSILPGQITPPQSQAPDLNEYEFQQVQARKRQRVMQTF